MSSASDIANLFEVVDASPFQYQEVERAEQMQGLRGRWSTLNAAEPDTVAPAPMALQDAATDSAEAPAAIATLDTADTAETVDTADTVETVDKRETAATPDTLPDAPQPPQPVACTISAAASEPPPVDQVEPEQPVVQLTPEPVVAAQQSAALSSVFARLMERNEPRADVAARGAP
ncbi:BcsR/BcsP family cellulose biosynthesis protein [Paraburkholderia sp. J10-1]|uniref:BcsR/BcsP family cellulose biosynthesis protein n=1 Tax=Paraburkholderia sp. J10-1 TaxID=2805430 RepID=UPI002AB76719|nr:BcsR/BcsP family cellulose biosynthesis protein [Paraburkholderia sp. J10-1]